MNNEPVKICPECGEEYSPQATTCADCGGTLVFSQELARRSVPLKESEAAVLVRQETAPYLEELGQLLSREGIRCTIRFHGCEPGT